VIADECERLDDQPTGGQEVDDLALSAVDG
jgi:hypothetical protein